MVAVLRDSYHNSGGAVLCVRFGRAAAGWKVVCGGVKGRARWQARVAAMGGKKKEAKGENVHVVVRIRPLSGDEQASGAEEVMRIGGDKTSIQVLLPDDQDYAGSTRQTVKKFALDGCLPTSTTQEECFDQSGVKTLLDSVRPRQPSQAIRPSCTARGCGR